MFPLIKIDSCYCECVSSGGVIKALCFLCLLYMLCSLNFIDAKTRVSCICLFAINLMKFNRVSLWDVILSRYHYIKV